MRVGSLCTGYGGLEMGLKEVFPSARLAWVADNDKAASTLLEARYPGVPNLGDIKAIDWSTVEKVDLLAAGIPCQPYSLAGARKGSDDDRDLVGAFLEGVRILRPKLVILENVPGFRKGGLPRVLGGLSEMGFHARWHSVRASEAGASHRRERVFVLAWTPDTGSEGPQGAGIQGATRERALAHSTDDGREWSRLARLWRQGPADGSEALADADGVGRLARGAPRERLPERQRSNGPSEIDWGEYEAAVRRQERVFGRIAPPPTEIGPRGNVRLSPHFTEWMMGPPPGWITQFEFARKDAFRLLGNGVVPRQAALAIRGLVDEESNCPADGRGTAQA